MTKKEVNHFVETILNQQNTINKQAEKIRFLEMLIDNLTKELELSRKK
jgi:hypothetical protein